MYKGMVRASKCRTDHLLLVSRADCVKKNGERKEISEMNSNESRTTAESISPIYIYKSVEVDQSPDRMNGKEM